MRSIDRSDSFSSIGHLVGGPAVIAGIDFAFSDAADIAFETLASNPLPPRGIMIASTGAIKVTTMDGKVDTYADGELAVGQLYPFSWRRVWATGTTVTKVRIYW